jgi:hypothetical protein
MSHAERQLDAPLAGLPLSGGQAGVLESLPLAPAVEGVGGEAADWSDRFVQEMRGFVRHSRIRRRHILSRFNGNNLIQILERVKLFQEYKDPGYLIDVARFAMDEWIAQEGANGH